MQLRIRSIIFLAEEINGYELVDPNGRDLPRFAAGAHIGVRLGDGSPQGVWRDYSLWNDPAEFRLYYCTRSPERTAFRDELDRLAAQGHVVFHHDGGDPARGLDVAALLREPQPGTQLYYCGPAGMMAAAAAASAHWPSDSVHCEYFSGPGAAPPARLEDDRPFRVRLARSGGEYEVPVGETIINVLRRHGIETRTSCELGYCCACMTRYLAGEPDHRDPILAETARKTHLLICCSRARSEVLELDL